MTLWSRLHSWIRGTLGRSRMESEMDFELRFHIEAYAEDLVRTGVPRQEAMRRARLEFGGIDRAKEECREARGANIMETLLQDLRYGARMLRKNPGFTAVGVLTLALGIGANTAVFSLVDGILLRPLPFAMPQNLVSVTGTYPKGAFVAMREEMQSLDAAAYFEGHEFNLTGRGEPLRLSGVLVSAEFFSVLGARPELGHPFYPGDDKAGQDNYVILSHVLCGFLSTTILATPSLIGPVISCPSSAACVTVQPSIRRASRFACFNRAYSSFSLGPCPPLGTPMSVSLNCITAWWRTCAAVSSCF